MANTAKSISASTVWKWLAVVAFGLTISVVDQRADGQDAPHQVRLAPPMEASSSEKREREKPETWYPKALVTLSGTIQGFNSEQLSIIKTGQAAPSRYAAHRVLEIKLTTVPDDQRAAMSAFANGNFTEALKGFVTSVSKPVAEKRPPVWRQQWLSMMAAQAAYRSGRGEISLEIVQQLDARPLPAMVTGILPIDWTGRTGGNRTVNDSMVSIAAKRASSNSMAVKLVAASWLLNSPKYQKAAATAIQRLANQSDRKWIGQLAKQLLWRQKLPPEIQSMWRQWEEEIETLPMTLQAGPLVSLAHHVEVAGLDDASRKLKMIIEVAAPTWHPDMIQFTAPAP